MHSTSPRPMRARSGSLMATSCASPQARTPSKRRCWCKPARQPGRSPVTLGYGRTAAGTMGSGVGFDLYLARQTDSPWALTDVQLEPHRQPTEYSAHAAFLRAGRRSGQAAAAF